MMSISYDTNDYKPVADGVYGYASPTGPDAGVVRLHGAGLGNLLFSWARCCIFCKAHGLAQIYTTWPQIKLRCWTHWEKDKRLYSGLFRPLPGEISGTAKLRLLFALKHVSENEWDANTDNHSRIVVFRGLKNHFEDIPAQEHLWLKERFFSALRDQTPVHESTQPHIGVHVRRGDFPQYDPNATSHGCMQIPISWYIEVLQRISAESQWKGEIGLCSDATEDELTPLLRLPNVRLVRGRTAQDDLIYLSKSILLVGSFSTFSQWAAYLSGNPSIWHPVFDRHGGLGNGSVEMIMSQDIPFDQSLWKRCLEHTFHPTVAGITRSE